MTKSNPPRRSDNSANVALLQEVWRKAYQLSSPLVLDFASPGEANSMRTKLYNAVRNVKNFPAEYPDLVEPVQNIEIVREEQNPGSLILRRKELSPPMLKLRQILASKGVKVEDASLQGTPKSRELSASIERLMTQAQTTPPEEVPKPELRAPQSTPHTVGHNPFFRREQQ